MRYDKLPIDFSAQIALLKERGMEFADENKALDSLYSVSYFRLASYWRHMEHRKSRQFKDDCRFEDVLSLYQFDQRLRNIVFAAIQNIEIAFRTRTYRMYIPPSAGDGAPLVVYTHGYGSRTRWRNDLNAAADSCGFAVCYPDGTPDSRGNDSWKVGYPSQKSMVIDEADFFRHLLDEVTARFGLSRVNVFMAGWSNGGDLCYQIVYTEPSLFRAYGSVGGLTFENIYNDNALTVPVPFLEIHGNSDELSMWQGDHLNTGGWGSYIPVPLAVAAVAANNRCTTVTTDTFPSKCDASRLVKRTSYGDSPSGCDVIVYEIEGGKHIWPEADVETSKILCDFFSRYIVYEVSAQQCKD